MLPSHSFRKNRMEMRLSIVLQQKMVLSAWRKFEKMTKLSFSHKYSVWAFILVRNNQIYLHIASLLKEHFPLFIFPIVLEKSDEHVII